MSSPGAQAGVAALATLAHEREEVTA